MLLAAQESVNRKRVRESTGAVAQLGERWNRTPEVVGSTPIGSTHNHDGVLAQASTPFAQQESIT